MKRWSIIGVLFALLSIVPSARADVLVLVHGYLSSAATWESSGITSQLEQNQWYRAGILLTGPSGVQMMPSARLAITPHPEPANKVYLAELPSTAPLGIQADHLQAMLRFVNSRHPKEKIILVGHSVGGVVARLVLVRAQIPNAAALITIASPHLGTPLAETALDATSDIWPVEVIKDIFAGDGYQTLKYSRGLYIDIVRPWPGSLLYWLNSQPHPPLKYVSVVRTQPFVLWGDLLVPGNSQDMNQVPPLAGKSTLYSTASGHALNPGDAPLLLQILKSL
ncbi:MAG: alpha/beta hydrolase [Magnetococcales bacterium]|nr:alpha/beta hydrolase [Magnetococcales bacterium]MBF0113828.1 alpha/beta hydrolase [Magnetococcales bacterium]